VVFRILAEPLSDAVGALVAIAAAFGAWWIGMRQLKSSEEGLAIARQQSAASALIHLVDRRTLIDDAVAAAKTREMDRQLKNFQFLVFHNRRSKIGREARNNIACFAQKSF
jgi:hypothetical protein